MKILHVVTTLDVGGAEMHLLKQVRGQTSRGHEVRVAYLKGAGSLTQDFRDAGAVDVHAIGGALVAWRLSRLMARVDVVHSHLLKADMLAALVALVTLCAKKLVASKHNDEQVLRRLPVSLVHGFFGNVPRKTIVLSDHVGRFIAEHGRVARSKLVRIYYGLDPAPFAAASRASRDEIGKARASLGFATDDVVFTCVARFAPQKAHDVLLRAFARARATAGGERLRLLLVGDDPFGDGRERAERLAGELALGRACVFAGIRRDVPSLMAASDVFVMCSLWEGLGLVFLEAMASSRPVLATNVSAVPEVVIDGETGVLVPPAQDEPLARAMLTLAADRSLRECLGKAGAERVERDFGLERMIDETLAVYRSVLDG